MLLSLLLLLLLMLLLLSSAAAFVAVVLEGTSGAGESEGEVASMVVVEVG